MIAEVLALAITSADLSARRRQGRRPVTVIAKISPKIDPPKIEMMRTRITEPPSLAQDSPLDPPLAEGPQRSPDLDFATFEERWPRIGGR